MSIFFIQLTETKTLNCTARVRKTGLPEAQRRAGSGGQRQSGQLQLRPRPLLHPAGFFHYAVCPRMIQDFLDTPYMTDFDNRISN